MTFDPYTILDRGPIHVDPDGSYLAGRRVMVTGAGGSIGSVICRHVTRLNPTELIMLDRDESALHALQLEMTGQALLDDASMVLGDIRDRDWISDLLMQRRPDVVFHAAALKHQPLLEQYPGEAWKTNVLGTWNLLSGAMDADVEVVVNISTDKAAVPNCALGASKRIAERLVSWCGPRRYMSVRFGNVFGSRGSVMDAFAAQLAADVPLTVTDPDVVRYFMTADEAVSLVIHAGAIGWSGEVLVLDMGAPVRIADIAERMIFMSGKDGKITYTGLRAGERLGESRLGVGEEDVRPLHPLISQVRVPGLPPFALWCVLCADINTSKIKQEMLTLC